jgi:surface antigen
MTMRGAFLYALSLSAVMALAGCATTGAGRQSTDNSVTPPPSKGADSAKVASNIIAAMNGGLIGGSIGSSLNDKEKRNALEAEYKALEYTASGQTVAWKSDEPSHHGEVVAAQPYRVGSQDCRQYTQTVYNGSASQSAHGTACRNADGSWTPLT